MTDPLYVQPDGVRSYAQIHDEVRAALSEVMGTAAPEVLGVETTHGPIASPVSGALSQVLDSRHGTLQATSTSAQTISELLQKAARMYEQGDQKGAATLKAAAEAMQNADAAGGGASGAGAAGAASPARPVAPTWWARWAARSGSKSARWRSPSRSRCKAWLKGCNRFQNRSCRARSSSPNRCRRPPGRRARKHPASRARTATALDPASCLKGDSPRRKVIRLRRVTPPMPAGRPSRCGRNAHSRRRRGRRPTKADQGRLHARQPTLR